VVGVHDEGGDGEELEVDGEVPAPAEAVVDARGSVVAEVIDEEHVPQHSSVVAGAGERVEGAPDGATPEVGADLPEHQDRHHVSRPNPDEPMRNTPQEKFPYALHFLGLLQHAQSHQEASDPEEGIDCEVGGGSEGGDAGGGEDVQTFGPVLDVGEAEPLIVAVDDPADGEHLDAVDEEEVLVFVGLGDRDYFGEVVVEAEALDHLDAFGLAVGGEAEDRPEYSQDDEGSDESDGHVVAPVHLRFLLQGVIEFCIEEGLEGAVGGILEDRVEFAHDDWRVDVGGNFFCALVGDAESDILVRSGEYVEDGEGEVGVLIFVVETVIIVSQIVQELP
jgi:hypothetical protein